MQDPATYIGDWPSMPVWSEDGHTLYFEWNPYGEFPSDSLFKVTLDDFTPRQVSRQERLHRGPHLRAGNMESLSIMLILVIKSMLSEGIYSCMNTKPLPQRV